MKTYLFITETTMKRYNCDKWWIDSNIIPQMRIEAENMADALKEYRERVNYKSTIQVSINAIKTKRKMYRDRKDGSIEQIGYIITGKDDYCRDDERGRWVTQYVDLWVEIIEINYADFEAA